MMIGTNNIIKRNITENMIDDLNRLLYTLTHKNVQQIILLTISAICK